MNIRGSSSEGLDFWDREGSFVFLEPNPQTSRTGPLLSALFESFVEELIQTVYLFEHFFLVLVYLRFELFKILIDH